MLLVFEVQVLVDYVFQLLQMRRLCLKIAEGKRLLGAEKVSSPPPQQMHGLCGQPTVCKNLEGKVRTGPLNAFARNEQLVQLSSHLQGNNPTTVGIQDKLKIP